MKPMLGRERKKEKKYSKKKKREEKEKERKNERNDKKLLNTKRGYFRKNQDGIFFQKKVEKERKK